MSKVVVLQILNFSGVKDGLAVADLSAVALAKEEALPLWMDVVASDDGTKREGVRLPHL